MTTDSVTAGVADLPAGTRINLTTDSATLDHSSLHNNGGGGGVGVGGEGVGSGHLHAACPSMTSYLLDCFRPFQL